MRWRTLQEKVGVFIKGHWKEKAMVGSWWELGEFVGRKKAEYAPVFAFGVAERRGLGIVIFSPTCAWTGPSF